METEQTLQNDGLLLANPSRFADTGACIDCMRANANYGFDDNLLTALRGTRLYNMTVQFGTLIANKNM